VGDFVDSAYWGTTGAPDDLDTLKVYPSACGRLILGDSNQTSMALTEALQLAGRPTPPNVVGLLDQLQCHTMSTAITKPAWDLEPARPHVGLVGTIAASCNPTPILVGQGASNQGAYQSEFTNGGRIWGLGLASNTVHQWGPGCIQDFNGGYRGKAAIMSTGCTGPAYWVGDQFWAYYERVYGGTASTVMGYPYNDSHRWGPGWVQDFGSGNLGPNILMQRDGRTSVYDVSWPFRADYVALGGAPGFLGFPTSDRYPWNGMQRQDFDGGSIIWDAVSGARLLPTATQQLVFYDNIGTVYSIYVVGPNQNGTMVGTCVSTPGPKTVKAGWWWATRTYVYTYYTGNCTGSHATGQLWIDPDGRTPYRCLIDTPPYTDWSCQG
jgi:hypothetical protein